MATTYTVEIDQAAATVPNFPRSTKWWLDFLPSWFCDWNYWLAKPAEELNANKITFNDAGVVAIEATNYEHAIHMQRWLRESAAMRYLGAHQAIRIAQSSAKAVQA